MKIAYLILAHNNPQHLQRLVSALSSRSCAFFIHIDRKASLRSFSNVTGKNVFFAQERVPVYWGDFSQVEAILILLRTALADQRRFDYVVLLSGTDYPLQPVEYIEHFFAHNSGTEFINIVQMPCEAAGKPIARLTTYKQRPGDPTIRRALRNLLVKTRVTPAERDYTAYLGNLVPYGGSTWWALSREACAYIQHFVDNQPNVVHFFTHTVCPDESIFQTILGNSPYKASIQRNLTYTDWRGGGANPGYITEQHLETFAAAAPIMITNTYGTGELLFARKFSDDTEDIVLRLDQIIRERGAQLTRA